MGKISDPPTDGTPFWESKSLDALSREEWEALCDGCGKCCLVKLEDEDNGTIHYTDVGCALLNTGACRCSDYDNRAERMPDCVILTPDNIGQVKHWMPQSCAYRLVAEDKPLPFWHHLISGDRQMVHRLGKSALGIATTEFEVPEAELPDHIIDIDD